MFLFSYHSVCFWSQLITCTDLKFDYIYIYICIFPIVYIWFLQLHIVQEVARCTLEDLGQIPPKPSPKLHIVSSLTQSPTGRSRAEAWRLGRLSHSLTLFLSTPIYLYLTIYTGTDISIYLSVEIFIQI